MRIGMPVAFPRLDLEAALDAVCDATDVDAVGIHVAHLGPGPTAGIAEGHAAAARALLDRRKLTMSTLNVTGDFTFDPFGGDQALEFSAGMVAHWLRLGAAMGAPRVMLWDGVASNPDGAAVALGRCIELGRELARIPDPPPVTVELHPFTFALAHDRVDELAGTLAGIGDTGFCFDFAHCAVALGASFVDLLPASFFELVAEVHWCDSDATTPELHYPPGEGVLQLDEIERTLSGRAVPLLWDLYAWPAPRDAMRRTGWRYADAVSRHAATLDARCVQR